MGVDAVDLLIVGGAVVTMNSDRRVFENGYVAIRGERVFDVGDSADLKSKRYKVGRTIDARGKVVLPGLINAHTHIPMTLFEASPTTWTCRTGSPSTSFRPRPRTSRAISWSRGRVSDSPK